MQALVLAAAPRPNFLIITVDDMSCDSVGVYGCPLPGTTPHMDRLAGEGLRFEHAHVQVGNCFPSRNILFSGRHSHNSGVEGFYQVRDIDYPVMCDLMKAAGYYTAIRGKVSHSTPYQPYAWDDDLTIGPDGRKLHIKDVPSYGACTKRGIEKAAAARKPFCLNINISDPHKPFWKAGDQEGSHRVSRIFAAGEVPVPGFLFDDPAVREELALYYTSVRRADDAVGSILAALEESGHEDNTVVIFLSDHGMPLPFAKTHLYHHSTRTPLMVKWPGVTKPGSVDKRHMVSAVDFLPTLLDMAGVEHPEGFDGRSFLPVIKGSAQDGRDAVFKVYNENSAGNRHPMRGIETRNHLYLFNPWSDGKDVFRTATNGTATYRRMKELAPTNPAIAARLEVMDHRTVEELYDLESDPDCVHNLVGKKKHAAALERLQSRLEQVMAKTGDHALDAFRRRDDPAALQAYIKKVQAESDARRGAKRKNRKGNQKPRKAGRKSAALIEMEAPSAAAAGQGVTVKIPHKVPAALGAQKIHVTLKDANGNRLERKVLSASGNGSLEVRFDVPATVPGNAVTFSAFIGEEFASNLQHLTSGKIEVR
ncbi:MAG: sulfatase-like hydrolase/transferase [Akkermansiaceae bacterium]|nr:sulfatase-like hydrolase/transferase [Akkermansiaceae bacterium]NNM29861.1 sulfatase-like hydrolase/transferase [Akkermansiaceae bacterium]